MKRTTLFALISLIVAAALVALYFLLPSKGQQSSLPPEALAQVSFGYQPFGNNLPFFVAAEKGYFRRNGVELTPVKIISANDAASAVVRGDIAGNATVPLNVILNIEENQPGLFRIFMIKTTSKERWSDYLLVRKNSSIRSIADLKGKKVGGYPGSAQQSLIKLMLRKFLPANQIITVELAPNIQLQSLESGQVDALLTYDELALSAIDSGIAQTLIENPIGKYVVDPCYGFPYVLSSSFVKSRPDAARGVRDAMYEAVDFIHANEAEARQIMAKWVGARPEIAEQVRFWEQVKADQVDVVALQRLADIFYQEGITKRRVETANLLLAERELR